MSSPDLIGAVHATTNQCLGEIKRSLHCTCGYCARKFYRVNINNNNIAIGANGNFTRSSWIGV